MNIIQDIRFGLRVLTKSPGFTLVAVLALALGIGVNTMMFTIYNGALLKSLPFVEPARLMHIHNRNVLDGRNNMGASYRELLAYRQQAHSFSGLAVFGDDEFTISDDLSTPDRIAGVTVTSNMFSLLGQKPALGRDFRPEDEQAESDPVAIISQALWQTRYGADPSVIGKSVKLDGGYVRIIGVMPNGMRFPAVHDIWIPIRNDFSERQLGGFMFRMIGRLRESVSLQQARTELMAIGKRIQADHPETNKGIEPVVQNYLDFEISTGERLILNVMMGAVSFVLLIACANVANLLLSRAVHRTRETSVRVALGASRWRVVRQLQIESILLSMCGGVLGLVFAAVGVRIFTLAVQPMAPYWLDFSMDHVALGYLCVICVITGILFGLAPALQLARTDINHGLKETGRSTSGGVRSRRLTGALVVAEISLTLILLTGASLTVRSLLNMESVDIGVRTDNLIAMTLSLPNQKYPQPADRFRFSERLNERLGAIHDLDSFTIASHAPAGGSTRRPLKIEGLDVTDRNGRPPFVVSLVVAPGYFRALGLSLLRGREFTPADGAPGAEAAIVNQRFADQYWPGEDPIGKRIQLGESSWATVVGVSPKIVQMSIRQQVEATAYLPYRELPLGYYNVLVRTRAPREAVVKELRDEVARIDPDLPLFDIESVAESVKNLSFEQRVMGVMFSVFALIGLILAAVGIYAVTAYSAGQRTQEIGVRMALGAAHRDVVWLVLRSGFRQLAVALPIGLVGAFGATRLLRVALFQVTPLDPATFISIPILLGCIVIAACFIPAWRAARLNPVDALRTE